MLAAGQAYGPAGPGQSVKVSFEYVELVAGQFCPIRHVLCWSELAYRKAKIAPIAPLFAPAVSKTRCFIGVLKQTYTLMKQQGSNRDPQTLL